MAFNSGAADEPSEHAQFSQQSTGPHNDLAGLEQTIEINFSPEKRLMLRRALDEYARSEHDDHEKITARRLEMRESIKIRFFEADADFDNHINRQEATEKLPQIARHFSAVDLNDDGLIALHELQAAQTRMLARRKAAQDAINMRRIIGESVKQTNNKSKQVSTVDANNSAM